MPDFPMEVWLAFNAKSNYVVSFLFANLPTYLRKMLPFLRIWPGFYCRFSFTSHV